MPLRSKAQMRKLFQLEHAGKVSPGTVKHWISQTKEDLKDLPEHVATRYQPKHKKKHQPKHTKKHRAEDSVNKSDDEQHPDIPPFKDGKEAPWTQGFQKSAALSVPGVKSLAGSTDAALRRYNGKVTEKIYSAAKPGIAASKFVDGMKSVGQAAMKL